jgi:hypothetical protein
MVAKRPEAARIAAEWQRTTCRQWLAFNDHGWGVQCSRGAGVR